MALSPTLQLRQKTKLAQSPALQLGMTVLAMPMPDLLSFLAEEAAENPFLEVTPPEVSFGGGWEAPSGQISLLDYLLGQIAVRSEPGPVRSLAGQIAGYLDDLGLLPESPATLARDLGSPQSDVAEAIRILQDCDPPGVAQPDIRSALTVQLCAGGVPSDVIPAVLAAAEEGTTAPQLESHLASLWGLDPYPAWGFSQDQTQYVRPDLVISLDPGGMPQVQATGASRPMLSVRPADRTGFGQALTSQARTLESAVAFRTRSLDRLGQALINRQSAFFSANRGPLVPLSRQELAGDLGLHPATVGRTISGKFLQWDGHTRPISDYFSAPVPQRHGPPLAARTVMDNIARLIAAEGSAKILSDKALQTQLSEEGVDIARRTIAKYRQCLKIPSSPVRRRLKARKRSLAKPPPT